MWVNFIYGQLVIYIYGTKEAQIFARQAITKKVFQISFPFFSWLLHFAPEVILFVSVCGVATLTGHFWQARDSKD